MDIGVLGGTFDPIHLGHLIVAEGAREQLGLERVLFVPAGEQWLKAGQYVSPIVDRVAMVRLGISDNPAFELSTVDVDREGPSYTVDTLAIIRDQVGPDARLFFIVGLDSIADLPRWHQPERLLTLCTLAAFPRPGVDADRLAAAEKALPDLRQRLVTLRGPEIGISATDLRNRVAAGGTIRYQVPQAVEEYIRQRGLYKDLRARQT